MYVLGLSGVFGHDAAACLIFNDKIVASIEEERLLRQKRAFKQLPILSSLFCLDAAGITLSDVDIIAASWNPVLDPNSRILSEFMNRFLSHEVWLPYRKPKVNFVDHHLSHAASGYFTSGMSEASILVMDGHGEHRSTSIGMARGRKITFFKDFKITDSLGHFYESVSSYCGLGANNPGKLMGLSGYGKQKGGGNPIILTSEGYSTAISKSVDCRSSFNETYALTRKRWQEWLCTNFGSPNSIKLEWQNAVLSDDKTINQKFCDIAYSAQSSLNDAICHLASIAVKESGIRNLVIAGGVGLNCSANGEILNRQIVDDLYIFPSSHDAGGALGAAFMTIEQHSSAQYYDPYLGPEFDETSIAETLKKLRINYKFCENVYETAATHLLDGQIIGWFQGRMECGPRALGNRSILSLPNSTRLRDRVNQIKGREKWRPLSPSMLLDVARQAFPKLKDSSYMLLANSVSENCFSKLRGVIHIDKTARPQFVTKEFNANYWKLLKTIQMIGGTGAVLNTSFNNNIEPIVCTPLDAIRTFFTTELNTLFLGNFMINKPKL